MIYRCRENSRMLIKWPNNLDLYCLPSTRHPQCLDPLNFPPGPNLRQKSGAEKVCSDSGLTLASSS